MATIEPYSLKNGERRYRVRYRTPDHRQTDKRGFKTKKLAEEFAAKVEVSKLDGTYVPPAAGRVTVSEVGTERLAARRATLKDSSYNTERKEWLGRVEPKWGDRALSSIRPSEVEDWITELAASGLSATVIQRAVGILRGIYQRAIRDNLVVRSPLQEIESPSRKQTQRRYLTAAQAQLLVKSCISADKRLLVQVLAYTGIRWGEATGLKVSDLDMLRGRIHVNRNVYRFEGEWREGTPKNHELRAVPFPKSLTFALAQQCEGREHDHYLFGDGLTPLSSPSKDGWLHWALKRARMKDKTFPTVSPHELRHTAASLAISAGANVKAVQRMLGHKSAAMTLDTYADLFDDDLDDVATALDALVCGQNVGTSATEGVCSECGTRLNTGEKAS